MSNKKKGYPFIILFVALAIVFGLSFLPWGKLTGGLVKDFNLFADLVPNDSIDEDAAIDGHEGLDPELAKAMESNVEMESIAVKSDSAGMDTIRVVAAKSPRVNGEMVIEDYTPDGKGLARFRNAMVHKAEKPARIAIIGDSYIEGDIFSQDIRDLLQNRYGGRGVGYVPAHSQVAGFRQSVAQSDNGWTEYGVQKASKSKYFNIAGEYFTSGGKASATYKGNSKRRNLAGWNTSRVIFIAPNGGTIKLIADSTTKEFNIQPSNDVQSVELKAETTKLNVECSANGMVFLGAWLEDGNGVVLDCMSNRGDSGISHRLISPEISAQMRKWVDYDLIIVEYGINALTATQKDYSTYSKMMVKVVERLKECYPNADIILLGIGDRGHKSGGEVHSMPTAPNMVAAQRQAAQRAGCLFWDTREAMGGNDAIVDWRDRKLVNGDYIHLNFQGGKELGGLLFQSLDKSLK